VRDARGNIAQIRGLMLDVTEQKTFQSQLQRERDLSKDPEHHAEHDFGPGYRWSD